MAYICYCCGEVFDEPLRLAQRENLDGERGIETRRVEVCPWCGEEEIDRFEEESLTHAEAF